MSIKCHLRAVLKRHGNSVTVHTSHEETEERSHSQELIEGTTVDGGDLEKTEDNHVENHGPLATELVTSKTEECSTDGSKQQCQGDGGGDRCVTPVVVCRQFCCLDGQGVEVKGIGCPGEEAHKEVGPVLQTQLRKQTDWVLQGLGLLPLAGLLAILIPDNHTLLPLEEVAPCLFGRCEGALGKRIGRSVTRCCRHCVA